MRGKWGGEEREEKGGKSKNIEGEKTRGEERGRRNHGNVGE